MPVLRADLHLRKRIGKVRVAQLIQAHGFRIVGLNRHQRDAAIPIIADQLLDAAFVKLRRGAGPKVKTTTSTLLDAKSCKRYALPSTAGRLKSGAAAPIARVGGLSSARTTPEHANSRATIVCLIS